MGRWALPVVRFRRRQRRGGLPMGEVPAVDRLRTLGSFGAHANCRSADKPEESDAWAVLGKAPECWHPQ